MLSSRSQFDVPPFRGSAGPRIASGAWVVLVGLIGFVLALSTAELSAKRAFMVAGGALVAVLAVLSGRAKQLFLIAWVVALTYNRNFFFEALDADSAYGPFWDPSDICFLLLLACWWFDAAVLKKPAVSRGSPMWIWFAPFAAACLLSAVSARRPDWVAYEMLRVGRIALILWYFRYQVGLRELLSIAQGFACAIFLQASTGFFYVLTGRQLGLSLFLGTEGGSLETLQVIAEGAGAEAFRRASGTVGHPNTLAVYFLMIGPVFLALAAAPLRKQWRWLCLVTGLTATATLAVTMSRASWMLHGIQWLTLAVVLAMLGILPIRRLLGGAAIGVFLLALAMIPLMPKIEARFNENFSDMLDFRAKHNEIAYQVWQRSPLTGVGLNNYSDILGAMPEPELATFREFKDYFRKALDVRITAWVHNIYLLILVETGLVGLTCFLFFKAGVLWLGARALLKTTGVWRAASAGLVVGVLGLYGHGFQEAALWIDPITYTFAALAGLINILPALASESNTQDEITA